MASHPVRLVLHTLITLLKKKIVRGDSPPVRLAPYNTLKEKNCQGRLAPRTASYLITLLKEKKLSGATRPPYGFVPYNTLKRKKIVRGDSPPLKEKKCILIISSTTTSPRASRTTKVAGMPLLPHCDYTLAVGNRSMPKDNRLSSLALLSDAYKPPIAPSIASPLSFSFPEAPRHCP